ncbi:putative proteinDPH OXIDASE [Salix koriyanagi]|uniref:ferric-chelate reductase (NADH) n=1 Tax=Salix koriyanagi TaxID=2511006 RepID=A0A9Q0UZD9_9ROSI|nr:putative proteinDPH OXIDASE [Salix koriyanagi]
MSSMAVFRIIFLVVFLGWLVIWILLPTKLYRNTWTPKLESKLNSTYFSGQGTNLLLLSFPMMFIAAFGCIYLHVQKQQRSSYSKSSAVTSNRLSFLRRPALVMAPLGIVTAMELAFGAMFISLLIWSLGNYLYVSFGHLHMHKQVEKVWQAKFRSVSLRLGYVGNICWAFLFFPVTRGSSILPLVGLTSESSIKYHIWLGHLSMILFAAHTVGFVIYWAMTNQMAEMLEWSKTWVSNVAGEIAAVLALAMWVTSSYRIRRKMFEVFFYTHQLYILFIVFYVLHVGAAYFCMVLPGIFLFVVDRYLRFLQSQRRARLDSARLLPCGSVELNFSKSPGLYYNPTSILFLNVPSISKLQWHPFTITSSCNMELDKLSVVVKRLGNWSQKLCQEISSSMDRLEVSVEGPYGPTSSHFLRHELLVLVSGGSGITPFISIIREIMFESTKPNSQLPRVLLVCVFKNSADLSMLDLLLPVNDTPANIYRAVQLQIEAYITREEEQPTAANQKLLQTIWFKPNQLDSPISAGSRPEQLAMARCNNCIIIHHVPSASSAVFLVRKKENAIEGKQIQNLEVPTPAASPGSWLRDADRELESLPHQSLAQATKVHFGARPDLKRILLDCKASDVGVLACGPRKMRHEVAKICSSGLADNLHFESISFNW